MEKILIISTGGTFNKIYDPLSGKLKVDREASALKEIASRWLCDFETLPMIHKDSLEMTNQDRLKLLTTIHHSESSHILIVHGTDTMDITAAYLAEAAIEKKIILTGAMVPYSIDPVEATANLASSFGYLQNVQSNGIYIVMHGIFGKYDQIKKDREKGKFILS